MERVEETIRTVVSRFQICLVQFRSAYYSAVEGFGMRVDFALAQWQKHVHPNMNKPAGYK